MSRQYTLILPAGKALPKACIRDKRGAAVCKLRRTVGVRLPDDPVCAAILARLSRPLLCTSVRVQRPDNADASQWLADPARIRDALAGRGVDFIVDAGLRAVAPSTVVDLSGPMPRLLRRGKGDWCVRAVRARHPDAKCIACVTGADVRAAMAGDSLPRQTLTCVYLLPRVCCDGDAQRAVDDRGRGGCVLAAVCGQGWR
jgi:hypothetical protein